jgi:hypothetical protein
VVNVELLLSKKKTPQIKGGAFFSTFSTRVFHDARQMTLRRGEIPYRSRHAIGERGTVASNFLMAK